MFLGNNVIVNVLVEVVEGRVVERVVRVRRVVVVIILLLLVWGMVVLIIDLPPLLVLNPSPNRLTNLPTGALNQPPSLNPPQFPKHPTSPHPADTAGSTRTATNYGPIAEALSPLRRDSKILLI